MAQKISNTSGGDNPLTELLQKMMLAYLVAINVAYIAKVVKVSPPTVSVQPLALTVGDNKKEAVVESARVLVPPTIKSGTKASIKLKTGDHVVCLVLDHDTTHYNGHGEFRQMTKTPHLVNNSVILGRVAIGDDFDGN